MFRRDRPTGSRARFTNEPTTADVNAPFGVNDRFSFFARIPARPTFRPVRLRLDVLSVSGRYAKKYGPTPVFPTPVENEYTPTVCQAFGNDGNVGQSVRTRSQFGRVTVGLIARVFEVGEKRVVRSQSARTPSPSPAAAVVRFVSLASTTIAHLHFLFFALSPPSVWAAAELSNRTPLLYWKNRRWRVTSPSHDDRLYNRSGNNTYNNRQSCFVRHRTGADNRFRRRNSPCSVRFARYNFPRKAFAYISRRPGTMIVRYSISACAVAVFFFFFYFAKTRHAYAITTQIPSTSGEYRL